MIIISISYSQLNISSEYREDLEWDEETKTWNNISSISKTTFFEFEDTVQSKMGIFIHRTDNLTSSYLIKSHKYSNEKDWDEFKIISDVGNTYTLYVKIGDNDSDGFLWFTSNEEDGSYRAVKHKIESIWITKDEEESIKTDEDNLYERDFSFKEYFIDRGNLDPIEGIWSLNVVRELYYYDSLIYTESEEMRSEWAIAFNDETTYKVYGLTEEANFEAVFEKTAIEGFYNYKCSFNKPDWLAKANVVMENNSILKYGYFVDDNYLQEKLKDNYKMGMKYFWDFTWIKKYPLGGQIFEHNSSNEIWKGGGTGFFIDRNGYFATNFHVIEGANSIEIEFYRDGILQHHKAEVIKSDKKNDLSILKISDSDFEKFDEIPYYFSSRVADVGEEVFALGYPMTNYLGKDIKFTDGKISSKTGYDGEISNYQTTTPIQPGNSGGPLFDYNGNLIGINAARFTHDNSQNISYSIKSSYLKNLIDVLPISLRLPRNKEIKDLKLTEKIKSLSDYVVLIKIR